MMPITASAFKSVTGISRSLNQDRHLVDQALGFALLADGVAGRPSGERAAQVAIAAATLQLRLVLTNGHCRDLSTARQLLIDAFRFADLAVHRCAKEDQSLANMASTLVGVLFVDDHAVMANVGDSRIYRLRHAFLKQVTEDHVLQREGLSGLSPEEIAALRPLQLLSRAVGYRDFAEPDLVTERLSAQDVFLLCSNGLSDVLERHQMAEVMARASSIEDACNLLVEAAVAAGADDDVTAVLVQPGMRGRDS